jgi:hypothetical protein
VSAPDGTTHEVVQGRNDDRSRYVEILIERTSIHRCLECVDGVWR